LLIAIAPLAADRLRLAELVNDYAPLLLVSSVEEVREMLDRQVIEGAAARTDVGGPAMGGPAMGGATASRPPAATSHVLTLDSVRYVLHWIDREEGVTTIEHDLLACLGSDTDAPWTYERLHEAVWRTAYLGNSSDLQSAVKRLRHKLASLGTTVTIDAIRGVGFRLSDHVRPHLTDVVAVKT
jgi:DNA-binding response OmpR family regulator